MSNTSWNTLSSNTTEKNIMAAPYYVSAVFLALTQLFGVVWIILVIYSIVSQRSLLKSNYYFLVLHLAFCDLMVLMLSALTIHTKLGIRILSSFVILPCMCKVWEPTLTFFLTPGCLLWWLLQSFAVVLFYIR